MEYIAERTTNHQEVTNWIADRNGIPGRIRKDDSSEEGLGYLKIYFPDVEDKFEGFEEITINEFLEDFENQNLEIIYQENEPTGKLSYFYKFNKRV